MELEDDVTEVVLADFYGRVNNLLNYTVEKFRESVADGTIDFLIVSNTYAKEAYSRRRRFF